MRACVVGVRRSVELHSHSRHRTTEQITIEPDMAESHFRLGLARIESAVAQALYSKTATYGSRSYVDTINAARSTFYSLSLSLAFGITCCDLLLIVDCRLSIVGVYVQSHSPLPPRLLPPRLTKSLLPLRNARHLQPNRTRANWFASCCS